MDLKTYIAGDRGRASRLACTLKVSRSYLSQMASGTAPVSPERCVAIWEQTDGLVTRQELRPEDWYKIWPDLRAASEQGAASALQLF